MDTEFSSRLGYPVEIELLWLAALRRYCPLVAEVDAALAERMSETERQLTESMNRFVHGDHFVDHLDRSLTPVDLLTPNGYFWSVLGLHFDPEWEERSLALGRWELGGISGVRTLARSQWEMVLGPQIAALARAGRPLPSVGKVNYHRGVEWNWLTQLFVAGELRYGRPDLAFDHYLARQIYDCLFTAGLGGISEVFDHRGPAGPDFQAWSMLGLIASLHAFTGIDIDVPANCLTVAPQKPRRWPHLSVRRYFDHVPFVMEYRMARAKRTVVIEFEGVPECPPEITVRLPLPKGLHPPRVSVVRDGAQVECAVEMLERQVQVRFQGGVRQEVRA
jgi:glycogen debranching enzyme